jgi:hypothetical protein
MREMIAEFNENETFSEHLANMFPPNADPPNWDRNREYVNDGRLVVYAITREQRLLRVGKKMTLKDLVGAAAAAAAGKGHEKDGLQMTDGQLSVVVVLKGAVEEKWVTEFKKLRDE